MKNVTCIFIASTLFTALATGCGNQSNAVQPYIPQTQQVSQVPANVNPAYQQTTTGYEQVPAKFPPDSPDMSNPANSNLYASPSPKAVTKDKIAGSKVTSSTVMDNDLGSVPELAPSSPPASEPEETPEVKVPWYKKVIEKVKGIFSKD